MVQKEFKHLYSWLEKRKLPPQICRSHAKRFSESFQVGIEIEANIPPNDCCNNPQQCSYSACSNCPVCDDCPVCDSCGPEGTDRCIFCQRCSDADFDSNGECRNYNFETQRCSVVSDICDECVRHDVRCEGCNPCDRCPIDPCEGCELKEVPYSEIAAKLGCTVGKETYVENPKSNFLYIYDDGSVNLEIVTAPHKLNQLRNVLEKAYSILEDYDATISPSEKCGGHQTFSYKNYFKGTFVINATQLVRYFLPSLFIIGWTKSTDNHSARYYFCTMPERLWNRDKKGSTINNKYDAIHIKPRDAVKSTFPKFVEYRYPDGNWNIDQVIFTAIINAALTLKAIKMSAHGIMTFTQEHFDNVQRLANDLAYGYPDLFKIVTEPELRDNFNELTEILKPEIHLVSNLKTSEYLAIMSEVIDNPPLLTGKFPELPEGGV